MKDLFSSLSDQYARFRPTYTKAFFDYLDSLVLNKGTAWDCGTGNGQVATILGSLFETVYATDISKSQIDQATQAGNIHYSVQPAEQTNFPDQFFDLVVVAQAVHWFDFGRFYSEVRRTGKANAVIAIIGYGRLKINQEVDAVLQKFYTEIVGGYWDKERRYIDENYQTIPFPFEEIKTPKFANQHSWTLEHLVGYLGTWSAVKHYMRENKSDPVDLISESLMVAWGQTKTRQVTFPLLIRVGRV